MASGRRNFFAIVKRCLLALFALTQLFPAGMALASDGDSDFTLVICTAGGARTVSWQEVTGEASPFKAPEKIHENDVCDACVMGACSVAGFAAPETFLPNVVLLAPLVTDKTRAPVFIRTRTGPPLPSRAPPTLI